MIVATILIADDDDNIRKLMSLYLRKEGFDLEEAGDGTKAMSIIENSHVDLVILDIMMPGLNGWELCREIRRTDANLPLLMVTAKAESAHKVKGFQLGTDDYLTKPFDPVEPGHAGKSTAQTLTGCHFPVRTAWQCGA